MHYAQQSNQVEFKGIYYNESKEQMYFEGGAHFRYKDLFHILEKLKSRRIDSSYDKKVIIQRNDSNCKENNDFTLKQPRTRNNNAIIDKAITKQPTTCRNTVNQKNYFLNQCIQSKYFGLSLYTKRQALNNNNNKTKQIQRIECVVDSHANANANNKKSNQLYSNSNAPKPKSSSVKRIQSEEGHSNAFAKTAIQTARQNGRETGSNTQRAKEYSDQIKTTTGKSQSNQGQCGLSRNVNVNSMMNANPNTFVFSNGYTSTTKPNKSRNTQKSSNGLFDSMSFQTKQSWRGKDKDNSIKNTIDKMNIGMGKKTITIRKVNGGGSISLTNRMQKASIDKYQKISYITNTNKVTHHQKTTSNIGLQNKTMRIGFLASFDK